MSIRIIEDGPEITLTRSEYERLLGEWRTSCTYSAKPLSFEEWVRNRQKPRQAISLPVIDPKMLEVGK